MEIEFWYDDRTVFWGKVSIEDNSFSHERGVERKLAPCIDEFSVTTYISNMDYDVTAAFDTKTLDLFKERFLEHVMAKHWSDMVSDIDAEAI